LDQPIEELLERIWAVDEEGRQVTAEVLSSVLPPGPLTQTLRQMVGAGLVEMEGNQVALTRRGKELAEQITRRHRLAERLLTDVLDVGMPESETSACRFEHILSEEVTDSICTLLGHPRTCPHGKPIPPGPCCLNDEKALAPLVVRLSDFQVGQRGRVAYIHHRHHNLERLASIGLLPGVSIRLEQRRPSFVVSVGESEIALDSAMAREIYVRPFGLYMGRRRRMGPRRRFLRRGR